MSTRDREIHYRVKASMLHLTLASIATLVYFFLDVIYWHYTAHLLSL